MLISIIIPTYNEEHYLGKTLESIKNLQTDGFSIEVLVVDGGSTDKTVEVAKAYGVTVLRVAHRGIGFARQQGLLMSKGEIIAYTDADTIVPSTWLDMIVSTLKAPGVVGVYGTFRVPDGWWVYRFYINYLQPPLVQALYFIKFHLGPGQNMGFWRAKALSVGGFDQALQLFEDFDILTKLSLTGNVLYVGNLCVVSSGRRGNEGWRFFLRNVRDAWDYFINHKKASSYPGFR